MREILVATKNKGKFREISEFLDGLSWRLVFLGDLGLDDGDFVEDGVTFRENALKKAKYYGEKTGMLALGEDSGVLVDALPGQLGVKTRRWGAGEGVSDEEWVEYFLKVMSEVPEDQKGAQFVCCACLFDPAKGEANFFEGAVRGKIANGLLAPILVGLPLSSCFVPEGLDKCYAALSTEEKNRVSHRGRALKGVRNFLELDGNE